MSDCRKPCLDSTCETHFRGPNAEGRERHVRHRQTVIWSDSRTVVVEDVDYVTDDGHVQPAVRIVQRRLGRGTIAVLFPACVLDTLLEALHAYRNDVVALHGAHVVALPQRQYPPRTPELSLAAEARRRAAAAPQTDDTSVVSTDATSTSPETTPHDPTSIKESP